MFLDQAAEGGYKALELGPIGYLPTDIEQLKDDLGRRGLSVCGGSACYDFLAATSFEDVRKDVDDICKRLQAFNVKYLMTMDGSQISREDKAGMADVQKRTYDIFGVMGRYCADTYGIQVLMHPERLSLIETHDELVSLIDRGLSICYDTGHYAAANGSWQRGDKSVLDFMKEYHDRIPYLHFKNVNPVIRKIEMEEGLSLEDPRQNDIMCDLEDGVIDYKEFRDLLDSLNFEGVGIIEQDCPNATTDEAYAMARKNLQYLQRINMIP